MVQLQSGSTQQGTRTPRKYQQKPPLSSNKTNNPLSHATMWYFPILSPPVQFPPLSAPIFPLFELGNPTPFYFTTFLTLCYIFFIFANIKEHFYVGY